MPSILTSFRRNSAGSHLSSLRRVSRKRRNGISRTKNGWIMLLLGCIRSIMIICIRTDNVFFSKTYPSFLTVKEGSTSLTKPLFPQGREENRPTVLIFLPLRLSCKESSTFSPSPSSSGSGDVTALRCSEPLRSKVGGPSKAFAIFCGMGPPGVESL